MPAHHVEPPPVEEPLAGLERRLIDAFLTGAGQDAHALRERHDEEARTILIDASRYASQVLSEIEARSHYLHALRGEC